MNDPVCPPAFRAWWRPSELEGWQAIADGPDYDTTHNCAAVFAACAPGEFLVTAADSDPNDPATALRLEFRTLAGVEWALAQVDYTEARQASYPSRDHRRYALGEAARDLAAATLGLALAGLPDTPSTAAILGQVLLLTEPDSPSPEVWSARQAALDLLEEDANR